jgi:hypothetical protein
MPNPTVSALHHNVPLTNISIAYIQNKDLFIAERVFPRVPVEKQSDLYWKYHKGEWRRTDVEKRAPSTESVGVGWNVTQDSYFCHVFAVHKDVDDQLRANADAAFNLDRDATEFITQQLMLHRDIDFVNTYFASGVWDNEVTGVPGAPAAGEFQQWDQAGSTPIEDVTGANIVLREQTGFAGNTLLIGPYVLQGLQHHADILERIKYTQRGVITEELLASLFGVNNFLVAYATRNLGEEYQDPDETDDNATYEFITGSNALLVYSNPSPSLMTPSGGYIFTWTGYPGRRNQHGLTVRRFRMEHIRSDRIEAEMSYDMKVVATDVGFYFDGAVA